MSNETEGNSKVVDNIIDDSNDFFGQLEGSVNGIVAEGEVDNAEVTQSDSGSERATHDNSQGSNVNWDNEDNPYKKRYTDSSREAVKMNEQLRDLKPFVPVLDAMKRDSGLVDHVRSYFKNGGQPAKTVKEQLNLDEDFIYDATEAVENPDSDSAKVMNAHIDGVVQQRVGSVLQREKQNAQKTQAKISQKNMEKQFVEKHGMTDEEFTSFKEEAKSRKLTIDDVYYLLNKDKANKNVANSTKKEMLNQMKNVRDIPSTASDSNSQGTSSKSKDDELFDGILGLDGNVDNLFG
jgi:surface antigen|tara:strand:- start:1631 stop:2509 length:879 start_codon:yes stop_codon:yes gene_type:complete